MRTVIQENTVSYSDSTIPHLEIGPEETFNTHFKLIGTKIHFFAVGDGGVWKLI